jgi:hypothetical protein
MQPFSSNNNTGQAYKKCFYASRLKNYLRQVIHSLKSENYKPHLRSAQSDPRIPNRVNDGIRGESLQTGQAAKEIQRGP